MFPERTGAFRSRHYLRTRGEVIAERGLADEEAMKFVLPDVLAEPVKLIIGRLGDEDSIKAEFDIGRALRSKPA